VLDYLAGLTWDKTPRLETWLHVYLGADHTPLNAEMGKLVLVAAVRRARRPGCKFDQILVLEGEQGGGKSSALEILAGKENFSDQSILGHSEKEQQEAAAGVWIHEIAELAGLRRTEREKVKAFCSRTSDRARPAWGRYRVDRPRRGIHTATTNEDTYLKDDTGDRRFWPVRCGTIDLEGLRRDRDQLWAEAAALEAQGIPVVLGSQLWGTATEEQAARFDVDPWTPAVAAYASKNEGFTAADVLHALLVPLENIDRAKQMRVGYILQRLNFTVKRPREQGLRVRRYYGPTGPTIPG
jgi:predicted P-loop ATPase